MIMDASHHLLILLPLFLLLSVAVLTYLILRLVQLKGLENKGKVSSAAAAAPHPPPPPPPLPPGSSGLPLIGETLAFISAKNSSKGVYHAFVKKRHLRYGKCFKTSILGNTHIFVSGTEVTKAILGTESVDFSKRYLRSIAQLLGDQSLLCASHEQHKFIRHHIANMFTSNSMGSTIQVFDELVIRTLSSWEKKSSVLVLDDALEITFNAICKMLMSLENEEELKRLRNDVSKVSEAMLAFPLNLPGTTFYKGLEARRRIMKTLARMIDLRRKGLELHDDFLQNLITVDKSLQNESLTDQQVLDNILTLIIAGEVTTASSIAWMIKYLDDNQEIQEKLRVLHLELADKVCQTSLVPDALNNMLYASQIVKESLRMATIVSWFPRVALKSCEMEGFHIQKGWTVNVDVRSIHFDPNIYHEPMKFNPSRFDENPKQFSYLAFGTGARTCLGMNLAKAMMLVFLHRLVTTYRWKVTEPDESLEKGAMFPTLQSRCPITVTKLVKEPKGQQA